MRYILTFSIFASTNLMAQNFDYTVEAFRSYLPSSYCSHEYYQWNESDAVFHDYHKQKERWKYNFHKEEYQQTRKSRGNRIRNTKFSEGYEYLICQLPDSIFLIPTSWFYVDSVDQNFLKKNGFLINDTLVINTESYKREYYKPVDTGGKFGPIMRFDGMQIDGEWLGLYVIEQGDTLVEYFQGSSMMAKIEKFNEWLIFYELYNQYGFFPDLKLAHYFSKENLTREIRKFVGVMRDGR